MAGYSPHSDELMEYLEGKRVKMNIKHGGSIEGKLERIIEGKDESYLVVKDEKDAGGVVPLSMIKGVIRFPEKETF